MDDIIKILIPETFQPERMYIIDIFFKEFLGIEYSLEIGNINQYKIILPDNKFIIIEDHFFGKFAKESDYLELTNIPETVHYAKNRFTSESDIPVIFGNNLPIKYNQSSIVCGIDIFASAFFMLSRWEEYVNITRDKYNRFPASASLAFKNGFLNRPVVNEYVEMLWNMLKYLGYNLNRKERTFELIVTHDVDHIKLWNNNLIILRVIAGDIFKRKKIAWAYSNLKEFIHVKRNIIEDPFNTFTYLMDLSESAGLKSHFYFMSGGTSRHDNYYSINDIEVTEIINIIKVRGHIIGLHGSYDSYNNPGQWKKEKETIEKRYDIKILESRQHFLRFDVPITWQICENNGMMFDSSCCYADREGFRCGTGDEFSVFNILTRKKLKLKERPTVVMEKSFDTYQNVSPEYMERVIDDLLCKIKKFNGHFVIVWHNSSFNTLFWKDYKHVYENILYSIK